MSQEGLDDGVPSPRELLRQMAGGIVVLLVVAGAAGFFVREPLEAFSGWFVAQFGLAGVFFGVLLIDASPFLFHEPLLLVGYSGGLGFWPVYFAGSVASVLAGPLGWVYGRFASRFAFVQRTLARHKIDAFLHRYGYAAVTIAALTPFPYAVATVGAGASGVPLWPVFLGSLWRFVKVAFYFGLLVLGWDLGGLSG